MSSTTHLEPGRVVAGRYRIEGRIGDGGMGAVYQVRHVHTDESLALKVLHAHVFNDQSAVERFRREARAPARIGSEHVARVTDADTAADLDGAPFFVMELLRGKDLDRVLTEEGQIAAPLVVEYLRQAARALDKAHAMGIVHRDLKPENLFLTHREDGSPCIKLLDFGIARLADAGAPAHMKTQAGFVFGTPTYMAPEQTLGEVDEVGPATDVWALGLVAFKLLVGQDFWNAQTLAQLYAMILSEPIPTPSSRGSTLGPAFDGWFARCVAPERSARFASAGEAVADLASALGVPLRPSPSSVSPVAAAATAYGIGPPPGPPGPPAPRDAAAPAPTSDVLVGPAPSPADDVAGLPPKSGARLLRGVAGLVAIVLAGVAAFALTSSSRPSAAGIASPSSAKATAPAPTAEPNAATTGSAAPAAVAPSEPTDPGPRAAVSVRSAKTAVREARPEQVPRDQKKRLDALQRLCSQGTFSAAECNAKRQAILRDEP